MSERRVQAGVVEPFAKKDVYDQLICDQSLISLMDDKNVLKVAWDSYQY